MNHLPTNDYNHVIPFLTEGQTCSNDFETGSNVPIIRCECDKLSVGDGFPTLDL